MTPLVDAERCERIIAEARVHVGSLEVPTASCLGWRVRAGSEAAALLTELGWPIGDAQVVGYGVGGGYSRHTDGAGRDRVLMVQLSDPGGYVGGVVTVGAGHEMPMGRGVAGQWLGSVPHEVSTVIAGERWALVAWRAEG